MPPWAVRRVQLHPSHAVHRGELCLPTRLIAAPFPGLGAPNCPSPWGGHGHDTSQAPAASGARSQKQTHAGR